MFLNSLKFVPKCIICGLFCILCLIYYASLYSQDTIKTSDHSIRIKHEIATSVPVSTTDAFESSEAQAIILWWTPFIDEMEYTKNCGASSSVCFFTGKRNYLHHEKLTTLLFYGSNVNASDMPLPRSSTHIWALLHEESPKNMPFLMYNPTIDLFNLTATFSQNSDFPLTLQYLESLEKLIDRKYFIDVKEKNSLQINSNLAPVLFIQSICTTMSARDEYVSELMKYVAVDSYGKCLNNKVLPKSLSGDEYLSTIDTDEFYRFLARYKFVIAYENGICNDYITEKLWRPLTLGVVPIYFGAPNVDKWLPNNNSIISIKNSTSPRQLADFIKSLNNNDKKYNEYLQHKLNQKVTNKFLLNELQQRAYDTNSIVEDFECFVCQKSVESDAILRRTTSTTNHYESCDENVVMPKMSKTVKKGDWVHVMKQGKCEADLIREFVVRNVSFGKTEYEHELVSRYNQGSCQV